MAIFAFFGITSLLLLLLLSAPAANKSEPIVPAMFMFGDSTLDVGNNNHIYTFTKANFLPYGRDFIDHQPTGRFSNGKLAIDFIADTIGFTLYQPAYLSEEATGKNLLIGASFASASSGYFQGTADLYHSISLTQQLEYYKEYKKKLARAAGKSHASSIIRRGIYLISAGSSDYLQNYYFNPLLYEVYTPEQFADILVKSFSDVIQKLYKLGARKIGVTSLPPLGCLPTPVAVFGDNKDNCVKHLNRDAVIFNNKLNSTSHKLQKMLSGLTLVIFDIYTTLYNLSTKPEDSGFAEARRACCMSGPGEMSFRCSSNGETCMNATDYVFWDGVHPTEAANKIISADLIAAGISLLS
ncbi:hypothetical protein Dimus_009440 [Dionaea muscipula]